MPTRTDSVAVDGGAVPVHVAGPDDPSGAPGLVVVPSIFGPAPDLLAQMETLADRALTVVADPFWHEGAGAVPYGDRDTAFGRVKKFDFARCASEMAAVIEWTRERCNGRVAGLGICFGGPYVLRAAADGALAGVVTWHGSRMENALGRAGAITCPLRLHFGEADPISPPEAIDEIRAAFADHPDAEIVVHPGLSHGFSHAGAAYDEKAAQLGIDAARDLLAML